MNKDINNYTNPFKCMVDDFISLRLKNKLLKSSMMIDKVLLVIFIHKWFFEYSEQTIST